MSYGDTTKLPADTATPAERPAVDFAVGDDLSDLFGNGTRPVAQQPPAAYAAIREQVPAFAETCPKCRGSGKFVGRNGRVFGPCYTCKGAGKRSFKTSPETRQHNRDNAAARQATTAAGNWEAFIVSNPAEAAWVVARKDRFDFAKAMFEAVGKWGQLTERQLAKVVELTARDAERDAARAQVVTERAAAVVVAPVLDISAIVLALNTAHGHGLGAPTLRVHAFVFKRARDTSRNPGSIYVLHRTRADARDPSQKAYLGKIANGRFIASAQCTPADLAELGVVAADPIAAAIAFGRDLGVCACCGRQLTDAVSVQRGIGPICADTFGF